MTFTTAYLATGSSDSKINFWNPTNYSLSRQINNGAGVNTIISLFNNQVATTSGFSIRIWNILNNSLIKTFICHSSPLNQLAISPNQLMIASASNDFTSKVWNISSGECISTMYGHTNNARSVVFYSNDILITGSYDISIKVWSINSGNGTCLRTLTGHTSWILSLAILPNCLLASGANELKIWNVTNGRCVATLTGQISIRGLVVLSNGLLASGSQDTTIKLWNLTTFTLFKVYFSYLKN